METLQHKHFPQNKFTLIMKKETLKFRGLGGIDFVDINHGACQVLPRTTGTRNT